MKTLEELLAEKKKIEEQIRTLKNTSVCTESGRAMLYRRKMHYWESDEDDTSAWSIGVKSWNIKTDTVSQKRPIITGYSKEEVIAALPQVISELKELCELLKEGESE